MNREPVDIREVRLAHLRAAAEALVAWVQARRATWPSLPAGIAPSPPPPQVVAALPPSMPGGSVVNDATVDDAPAPEEVRPAAPAMRLRITARAPSLQALLRWSWRLGLAAALLAMVVGAGWAARTYWLKRAATSRMGTAVLESTPPGSEVLIDGTAVGNAPLTTELTPGHHVVEFRRGKATRKLEVDVAAGRSTVGRLDWTARSTGRLVVQSEPVGARVLIDGRAHGVTPLTIDSLSVGSHVVVLESDEGSVRRTVELSPDRTAQITESIYAGWLKVLAPFELEIAEGTRGIRLDERNQVLLPPGPHDLRLENRALGYRDTRHVEIEPGRITSLSLASPHSTLTVTATLAAEVRIDGEHVGETPLTDQPVTLGTHDITVKSAAGAERRFTMSVTVKPIRIDVDFSKP